MHALKQTPINALHYKILGILVHVLTIQYFYKLKMKDINHLAPYEWPRRNYSLQYQYNVNTMSIQCRVTSDEKWQLGDH